MKLKAVVLAAMLLCSTSALAETIRVLGVQEALLSSKAADAFRAQMEREFAAEEKTLLDLEKQAIAARDRVQKNQGLVSDQELEQMHLQFQKAFGEYQARGESMTQRRMEKEQEFLTQMRPKLDQAIRTLIENEKIEVIVAKQATVYANTNIDITPRVIELLNKQ
ncbi:OmpH family outer membrane protein [Nitrincola tapanii]|uniref:OmpH family outer membrane protein n=1 Tax=Nitrincola tapanii TaxID=1708751 RepID=A0A5A9W525_9GAMM|nr:OmpH family outer membrane protein [Nitrincola tapanii]KAA0874671.1 OmpH family outer membrane protein [Nitrincola tapanii]